MLRRCLGLLLTLLAATQSENALRDPTLAFWKTAAPAVYRVRVETTCGDFVMEVHRDWAPIGADRFYNLVRAGFYNDSRFFRVVAGRFAQFGIAGDPQVAAVWRTQTIPDDPVLQSNTRGTFAFAMTGPGARTTQIYINTVDQAGSKEPYSQDRQGFAPLGRVVSGMDAVDKLYSGYGESAGGGMRGGKQGRIYEEGNAHLDRDFPKLDKLLRATIERAE
jgi:cyclophilin family peptidyl-prolyl cis-trans isomerase